MARAKMHLHLKKGALRRSLGVKAGRKIPASMLAQAKHSRNALTRKRASLALAMRSWHHGTGTKHGM